jgi:hypothetical protein
MVRSLLRKMLVPEGRPAREPRRFPGKEEDDDHA